MKALGPWILAAGCLIAQWKQVDPLALAQSGMPFFAMGPDGAVYLSWIDPAGDKGHALRYSRWNGEGWTGAEEIAQGKNWFVNWADFPSLQVLPDGSMLAHWLARPDRSGKYGYGIRVARRGSAPNGKWAQTAAINANDTVDYAGFLSFTGSAAVYLSPPARRAPATGGHGDHEEHIKTLRFARFGQDGRVAEDGEVDGDVCSCCQTSTAQTKSGLIAAYRDHLPGEIRDISVVRFQNGKWSNPSTLHADGWKINGCPTEGPSVAAAGDLVGIAWMTRAGDDPRIQMALSRDGGASFQKPIRADDGNPLGRPALIAYGDRQFLLTWIEKTGTEAEIRVRRVYADGMKAASRTIAKVPASRITGLPKIAVHEGKLLVAWRDGQVRAGWLPAGSLPNWSRE